MELQRRHGPGRAGSSRGWWVGVAVGCLLVVGAAPAGAQDAGGVVGQVTEAETGVPVAGASVRVRGVERAVVTGEDGRYRLTGLAPGRYVLVVEALGHRPAARPDVIVDPGRVAHADVVLAVAAIGLEGISVGPGWFPEAGGQPVSALSLNAEEVRRAPGSAGDVSRVLFSLPSTAQVADNANDLFVRGGAPFENGFYIDGIQVPNINHFAVVGSSGGPIGLLNVELIDDVSFSAGAFSAAYGDRLSSIVEIDLREGATDRTATRVEMSMAGFGGGVEGPLGERGSYYVSARRSFLDFIVDAIGTGVAPRYGDVHGKLSWYPDERNSVSLLGLFGLNAISFSPEDSREDGNPSWGDNEGGQGTVGVSWRRVWNEHAFTRTSVSVSGIGSTDEFFRTATDDTLVTADRLETMVRFRTVTQGRPGDRSTIRVGADLELTRADYDYVFGSYTDRLGSTSPRLAVDDAFSDVWAGVFGSHTWAVTPRWDVTAGLRADYYDSSGEVHLAPRLSAAYALTPRWTLNAAAGVYHQRLPTFLLSQNDAFADLPAPVALHAVGGIDFLVTESTKLTVEGYGKWYRDLPLEVEDPRLSVVDQGTSLGGPQTFRTLVPEGRARSYGVEALLQKKLAAELYGLVSAAWTRSRYRDLDGAWRDRASDNRYLVNVVGGYRPSHRWEVSGRFSWAGGPPYTPFDPVASRAAVSGIVDAGRVNEARYPDYHALNLRIDRRFVFRGSALTVNASFWNVYDRENVALYYWNELENQEDRLLQWSFFPVFGLEWVF